MAGNLASTYLGGVRSGYPSDPNQADRGGSSVQFMDQYQGLEADDEETSSSSSAPRGPYGERIPRRTSASSRHEQADRSGGTEYLSPPRRSVHDNVQGDPRPYDPNRYRDPRSYVPPPEYFPSGEDRIRLKDEILDAVGRLVQERLERMSGSIRELVSVAEENLAEALRERERARAIAARSSAFSNLPPVVSCITTTAGMHTATQSYPAGSFDPIVASAPQDGRGGNRDPYQNPTAPRVSHNPGTADGTGGSRQMSFRDAFEAEIFHKPVAEALQMINMAVTNHCLTEQEAGQLCAARCAREAGSASAPPVELVPPSSFTRPVATGPPVAPDGQEWMQPYFEVFARRTTTPPTLIRENPAVVAPATQVTAAPARGFPDRPTVDVSHSRCWPSSLPDPTPVDRDDRTFQRQDRYSDHRYDDGNRGFVRSYESYADKSRRRDATAALAGLSFDGTDKSITWEYFADRYLASMSLAGELWNDQQRKLRLLGCIKGAASRTVSMLPQEATSEEVWNCLRKRYSAEGQESTYQLQLAKRTRDVNKESARSFLDDITFLCVRAFPRSSAYDSEMTIKKHFIMGHPVAYQNHLNASVNRERCSMEDLLQACRQYEELEINRLTVSARKPAVKALAAEADNSVQAAVAVLSDYLGQKCSGESSDSDSQEAGVYRTTPSRRKKSKGKSRRSKPKMNVRALLPPVNEDSYDEYEDEPSEVELDEALENIIDDRVAVIEASVCAIQGRPPTASGSFRPRYPGRRAMTCAYCRKPGHTFRYCRRLWADYPDGNFPGSVAQMIFNALMAGGKSQFERRQRALGEQKVGPPPAGVRAIQGGVQPPRPPDPQDQGNAQGMIA